MNAGTGAVRIGLSGWTYSPWRGVFYPEGLPRRQELAYAAARFASIEINGTFYGLQRPDCFRTWRDSTPEDFVFALKGPRYITHMLKLKGVDVALANFLGSGPLRLGAKLGPILWQFPARMKFERGRFKSFFDILPRSHGQASAVAHRHGPQITGRSWLQSEGDRPLRHAMEIRNDTFRTSAFIDLLHEYDIALVCADAVEWPLLMDLTTDFVYCRLHGSQELYASGYDEAALDRWAARIAAWSKGEEPADANRVMAPAAPPSRRP